jgi:hypothetical protein
MRGHGDEAYANNIGRHPEIAPQVRDVLMVYFRKCLEVGCAPNEHIIKHMRSIVTLQSDDATDADTVSMAPHNPFSAQVILISLPDKVSPIHLHPTHKHRSKGSSTSGQGEPKQTTQITSRAIESDEEEAEDEDDTEEESKQKGKQHFSLGAVC